MGKLKRKLLLDYFAGKSLRVFAVKRDVRETFLMKYDYLILKILINIINNIFVEWVCHVGILTNKSLIRLFYLKTFSIYIFIFISKEMLCTYF